MIYKDKDKDKDKDKYKDILAIEELKKNIQEYPHFPKNGIVFCDIMPLFAKHDVFKKTIDLLKVLAQQMPDCDTFVGIESRGFLLATPLALEMGKGFVPVRKKGKLPGAVASQTYDLEYGTDTIEMQKENILANKNYVIIDDLLATGGTAVATANLIAKNGGRVVGFLFLIDLKDLGGVSLLKSQFPDARVESLITY